MYATFLSGQSGIEFKILWYIHEPAAGKKLTK